VLLLVACEQLANASNALAMMSESEGKVGKGKSKGTEIVLILQPWKGEEGERPGDISGDN
jgi:hypothetical protein